jgi:alpha-beta hydrolase superfamily lysophospholipase
MLQILFVFVLIVLFLVVVFLVLLHLGFRAPRIVEQSTPKDLSLEYQDISILSKNNKKLYGWFLPIKNSQKTIIILHGWGGNIEMMLPIALPFHRAGFNVLLFDSRGHGQSDSDTFSSLPRFAGDLDASIDWLKSTHSKASQKIVLLGHSVGAGAVLLSASKRTDIGAVISISAFAHGEWMMKRYLSNIYIPKILIKLILHYVAWLIGMKFAQFAPMNTACKISVPVLIAHGIDDKLVPVTDAHVIVNNCPAGNLTLLEIAEAGHESIDKFEQHSDEILKFMMEKMRD